MGLVRRGVLSLVVGTVLLAGVVAPAVASDDRVPQADRAEPAQISFQENRRSDVNVTQEFRLTPWRPGEVTVRVRFEVPDRVRSLRTEVPADARVMAAHGFEQRPGREYRWEGTTGEPSVTYTLPVNETLNVSGPEGAGGDLVAVDAGDWALFQRPTVPTYWNYTGDVVGFDRRVETDGPGAAGEWLVFLGEHETYERRAHDQHFRLVVPASAEMAADPETVLDSMAGGSDALRIGDRDETVFAVAAPTDGVEWGAKGLHVGDADLWVRDVEPVAHPDNVWLHEYVHSRQQFVLDPEMRWFREATATYYAALLTLEQERIGYEAFTARLERGASPTYERAVLADQSTWEGAPEYDKGALVVGQLDRQIRDARERERTFQAVVRAMNADRDRTSVDAFLDYVGEYGSPSIAYVAAQYTGTAGNVSTWDRTDHVAAFGQLPARVGVRFPRSGADGAFGVLGPYRNATVNAEDGVVLVPGETLRVNLTAANAGGTTGSFETALTVNGTVTDSVSGTVGPNESTTASVAHTFEETGTYRVDVDGTEVPVRVVEPGEATVVEFSVLPGETGSDGNLTVGATVRNDDAVPAETTVGVFRNDRPYETRRVKVGPTATKRVTITVRPVRNGSTVLRVDGFRPVSVPVPAAGENADDGGNLPDRTPVTTATATAADRLGTTTDGPAPAGSPTTTTAVESARTTANATASPATAASSDRFGPGFGFGAVAVGASLLLARSLLVRRQ